MPAEIVVTGSVHLGEGSVVVIPSLSGTTAESVEALEYCRARGATIITLTGHADTPLAQGADHSFVNFAEDDTSCESFDLQSLLLALVGDAPPRRVRAATPQTVSELEALPHLLLEVKRTFESRAAELAECLKDEPYHIITGSGSTWPAGLLLRDVHPGGDAVDPDPSGSCLRLLPRHPRAGRAGRQSPAAEGGGRHPPSGGAGGEVRARLHRQGPGCSMRPTTASPGVSRPRALDAFPGAARDGAGTRQRASGGASGTIR